MSNGVTPPNLPVAPAEYEQRYVDQLNNVLRIYFNALANPGPLIGTTLSLNVELLPTQADIADLRVGDVYRDTTNNTLKVKV